MCQTISTLAYIIMRNIDLVIWLIVHPITYIDQLMANGAFKYTIGKGGGNGRCPTTRIKDCWY